MRISEILSEDRLIESSDYYRLYYSSKYKKALKKVRSQPAVLKKIDQIEDDLKAHGELKNVHSGIHLIANVALPSEYKQADLRGWRSVMLSKKNEIRLVFTLHDEEIDPNTKKPFRVVEIKLGRPSELGYTH